jgi:hypothetical protein
LKTFGNLVLLAIGFAVIVALFYASDPATFTLMVQSVYLDPIVLMPDLSLGQRVLSVDRLVMLAMIVTALGAALMEITRGKAGDRALVVAAACVAQLVLIVVDPSPFQYVYGWSALPTLAGIALLSRISPRGLDAGLAFAGSALGLTLVSLSLAHGVSGRPPIPGSILRITYDPPIPKPELQRSATPRLLSMMVSAERQQGLWNQLALLTEICSRVRGPVLAKFYAHPICLRDARYDWAGLRWPALLEGERDSGTALEFEALFAERPPPLVTWGKHHFRPPLTPWGRRVLKDYAVYDGFALRRDAEPEVRRPTASSVPR